MNAFEVVLIVWIDSETEDGWLPLSEQSKDFDLIYSVGLLTHRDQEGYHLAMSFDPGAEATNPRMRIPRGCVRKIVSLGALPVDQADRSAFSASPIDNDRSGCRNTEATSVGNGK